MRYILAIDQGTTGSRAILYDADGQVKASAYEEFPQYFPKAGWVEHDPKEIWQSVNSTMQNVLKAVPHDSVVAIGITNQRETTVVWDKETGQPVYNAIVWQCRRSAERCAALKKEKGAEALFRRRTGLPIDAYFSATKIEWILNKVPGARRKAKEGRLLFGTTDTWVLWNLTGGSSHKTDYSNASRTMIFNIEKLKWDEELLKEFNIPKSMLPSVQPSSGLFGQSQQIGLLPAGIPVAGIAGDQQAALFGQACFTPGTIKNTYGTGAFILLNTGAKRIISKHGLVTTLAASEKAKPVYALEGSVFIAGAAIQWLRDGLEIIAKAAESEKMAMSLPDNGGVYFVPALVGLGAPYWDSSARGTVVGLTRGTTRAHLVRAALEAMAYQTREVVAAMQKDSGLKIKELKVDGGAVANDFLCQFQADILGIDIVRPKSVESTARGAAYLAGLSAGFWKNTDGIKKSWQKDRVFKPQMKRKTAERLFAGWQDAVHRTLSSRNFI